MLGAKLLNFFTRHRDIFLHIRVALIRRHLEDKAMRVGRLLRVGDGDHVIGFLLRSTQPAAAIFFCQSWDWGAAGGTRGPVLLILVSAALQHGTVRISVIAVARTIAGDLSLFRRSRRFRRCSGFGFRAARILLQLWTIGIRISRAAAVSCTGSVGGRQPLTRLRHPGATVERLRIFALLLLVVGCIGLGVGLVGRDLFAVFVIHRGVLLLQIAIVLSFVGIRGGRLPVAPPGGLCV